MHPPAEVDCTAARSLVDGFLASAKRRPGNVALAIAEQSYTYAQLESRAWAIASAVRRHAANRPRRVAVFGSRSIAAYAGTLGALMAGAAFIPLNPRFPLSRTSGMIRRALPQAIVVDRSAAPLVVELAGNGLPMPVLVAGSEDAAAVLEEAGLPWVGADDPQPPDLERTVPPVLTDDLAYLLFTSGSTGEPKGVGVTHENVLHYLDVIASRYALSPDDRCSQTFDPTFDLSVHDMFVTWGAGAALHVLRPIDALAPVRFVNKHALTVWFSVPSVAALAARKGALLAGAMPTLRLSLFCGEPLPTKLAAAWQASAPNGPVDNLYGPTELTIACLAHRWPGTTEPDATDSATVPIGRPFPGLGALLVDDSLAPVPAGHPGELLVCGPQTSPGYWLDDDRTSERFVVIETSVGERKRFYRTGDRAIQVGTGEYVYLGRSDHQIKVLGFRVELGEIESALLDQQGVTQAVAIGWPVVDGSAQRIVAFVSGVGLDPAALKSALGARLPDYMTPEKVVVESELPLNANGKIDRHALVARLQAQIVE